MSRPLDVPQLIWTALACALLFIGGGALGYSIAHVRASDEVASAHTAADVCASAAKTQQATIDTLKKTAKKNRRELAATKAVADAAMAARDKLQAKLKHQNAVNARLLSELSHAHQSRTGLAVPADVAGRLWPAYNAHGDPAASH